MRVILNAKMSSPAPRQTHPVIVSTSWPFALCHALYTPAPLERASTYVMLLSQPCESCPNLHFGSFFQVLTSHFHMTGGYFQLHILRVTQTQHT